MNSTAINHPWIKTESDLIDYQDAMGFGEERGSDPRDNERDWIRLSKELGDVMKERGLELPRDEFNAALDMIDKMGTSLSTKSLEYALRVRAKIPFNEKALQTLDALKHLSDRDVYRDMGVSDREQILVKLQEQSMPRQHVPDILNSIIVAEPVAIPINVDSRDIVTELVRFSETKGAHREALKRDIDSVFETAKIMGGKLTMDKIELAFDIMNAAEINGPDAYLHHVKAQFLEIAATGFQIPQKIYPDQIMDAEKVIESATIKAVATMESEHRSEKERSAEAVSRKKTELQEHLKKRPLLIGRKEHKLKSEVLEQEVSALLVRQRDDEKRRDKIDLTKVGREKALSKNPSAARVLKGSRAANATARTKVTQLNNGAQREISQGRSR